MPDQREEIRIRRGEEGECPECGQPLDTYDRAVWDYRLGVMHCSLSCNDRARCQDEEYEEMTNYGAF